MNFLAYKTDSNHTKNNTSRVVRRLVEQHNMYMSYEYEYYKALGFSKIGNLHPPFEVSPNLKTEKLAIKMTWKEYLKIFSIIRFKSRYLIIHIIGGKKNFTYFISKEFKD